MGQWVITVAGIAILSVLCDIILPEGQTRKYVKTVFGVVVTLVIVLPIVNIFKENFSFSSATEQPSAVQQQYIESAQSRQKRDKEQAVKTVLQANGIDVESVSLDGDSVIAYVKGTPSVETEQKVRVVVSVRLPDSKVITVWV